MGEVLVLGAVIGIFYLLSKANNLVTAPLSSTSKLPSISDLLKKAAPIAGAGAGAVAGGTVLGTTALTAGGSVGALTATDVISQAPTALASEGLAGSAGGGGSVISPTVAGAIGTEIAGAAIGVLTVFAAGKPLTNFLTGGTANWSAQDWVKYNNKLPEPLPLPKYGDVTKLLKSPGGDIVAPSNVIGGKG